MRMNDDSGSRGICIILALVCGVVAWQMKETWVWGLLAWFMTGAVAP